MATMKVKNVWDIKKARNLAFLLVMRASIYQASGRSTNSTNAIGALSPARKPHLRIRK